MVVRLVLASWLLGWLGLQLWANQDSATPPNRPNRLLTERSPYLRQHAYNPIDWYPWGPEAFARAKVENKPIFLSIGYSTCHWCHVMARESFSDPAIARLLNDNFISIKVDREERPDVDRVYMTFLQASTGGGGWPMSVWLTPDLKPFFGGTYYAPEDRAGQPSFKTMLVRLADLWSKQHEQILQRSEQMLAALVADTSATLPPADLALTAVRARAFAQLTASFDAQHGGFGPAPKFPTPGNLEFLCDVAVLAPDPAERSEALRLVVATLEAMAKGGIHDHLAGGFHRYTVDAAWRVPHFEKMLYDQAQLIGVYLTAWQLSGADSLRVTAVDTLNYLRSRMQHPDGGFFTAEDAESVLASDPSQHAEGAFYVWTEAEVNRLLGAEAGKHFGYAYGLRPMGNVTGDAAADFAGQNILYRAHSDANVAEHFGLEIPDVTMRLAKARQQLAAARALRPRPSRDEKIITSSNGLAISAFARAAQVLGDPAWAATASSAATFVRTHLFDPVTGRLGHSYHGGSRDSRGFAEDYAFMIQGLLDLYEVTFDVQWLDWAVQLQDKQNELFADKEFGGYFANEDGDASVLLRLKEDHDGAEPSASSIAVRNLARLSALLHREDWLKFARLTVNAFGIQIDPTPLAMPQMLVSAGWLTGSPQQIILTGELTSPATRRLLHQVWSQYLPRRVLAVIDSRSRPYFAEHAPMMAGYSVDREDEATAYVCENFECKMPVHEPAALQKLLTPLNPHRP